MTESERLARIAEIRDRAEGRRRWDAGTILDQITADLTFLLAELDHAAKMIADLALDNAASHEVVRAQERQLCEEAIKVVVEQRRKATETAPRGNYHEAWSNVYTAEACLAAIRELGKS